MKIDKDSDIQKSIKEVLDYDGHIICDVDIGYWDKYEPRIAGPTPIEDMLPLLDREEFNENMIIDPYTDINKNEILTE